MEVGPTDEQLEGLFEEAVEVVPLVVVSQTFTARPSSIPDIHEFVRRCLADSPLTEHGATEVSRTVHRALLDAAGPTGSIHVSFRIFPEHVEVDVLSSVPTADPVPGRPERGLAKPDAPPRPAVEPVAISGSFADWMTAALRREGLSQEAAARQLGVSVKTVNRWVGGETEPRLRDLRRIQERFGDLPLG